MYSICRKGVATIAVATGWERKGRVLNLGRMLKDEIQTFRQNETE